MRTAVDIDWILWLAGTATGLAAATVVPYIMFTRHNVGPDSAFGAGSCRSFHRWCPPPLVHRSYRMPTPYSTALRAFGVVYGVPVWGFALLWAAIAAAITLRTAREHLPFSLTWWSFTFPVGTCVLGTSELALRTARGRLRGTLFLGAPISARTSQSA